MLRKKAEQKKQEEHEAKKRSALGKQTDTNSNKHNSYTNTKIDKGITTSVKDRLKNLYSGDKEKEKGKETNTTEPTEEDQNAKSPELAKKQKDLEEKKKKAEEKMKLEEEKKKKKRQEDDEKKKKKVAEGFL